MRAGLHTGKVLVSVNDKLLIVHNLFRTRQIAWSDIIEFGTDRRRSGRIFVRYFYVKLRGRPKKRIDICTDGLANLSELIDIVFQKATNAKFVIVNNVAWIPFTKEIEVLPWTQWDKSFLRN